MKATEYVAETYGLTKNNEYSFWDLLKGYPAIGTIFGIDSTKKFLYDDIRYFIDDFEKQLNKKDSIEKVSEIINKLTEDDKKMLHEQLAADKTWHENFGKIFTKVLDNVTHDDKWISIAQELYDLSSYETNASLLFKDAPDSIVKYRALLFLVLSHDQKNKEALLELLNKDSENNKPQKYRYTALFSLTVEISDKLSGDYNQMKIGQFALLQNTKGTIDQAVLQKIAEQFKKASKDRQQYRMKANDFIVNNYDLKKDEDYSVTTLLGKDQKMQKLFGLIEVTDEEKIENEKKELERLEKEKQDTLKKEAEEQKIKDDNILYTFGAALSSIH